MYTLTETKTDPKNPMVWKRDFLSNITKGIVAVHVVFLESKQSSQEQLATLLLECHIGNIMRPGTPNYVAFCFGWEMGFFGYSGKSR